MQCIILGNLKCNIVNYSLIIIICNVVMGTNKNNDKVVQGMRVCVRDYVISFIGSCDCTSSTIVNARVCVIMTLLFYK